MKAASHEAPQVLAVLANKQGKALHDHHLKLLRDVLIRDVLVVLGVQIRLIQGLHPSVYRSRLVHHPEQLILVCGLLCVINAV